MAESKKKGLFFNAFIISFQRIASAALGLITTPIILNVLGIEDFGLYTLIVGFVGALAFVNWSLTITTQRYVAFAIGEKNIEKQYKAFSNAMFIHLCYAFLLSFFIGVFGVYFIDSFLTIPVGREDAARVILFIVAIITFFTIISTPYLGVINAHENFTLSAVLGITGALLKLAAAFVLFFLSSSLDKLVVYTLLLLGISILVFLLNLTLTYKYHKETRFKAKYLSKDNIREMLSFMGWNLFSSLAVLSRNQGVAVLLNIFFGVLKNAAYGIALQINAAMALLSQGIISAITPKILKGAGSGEVDHMVYQMRQMTKLSLLLSSFFAIPFLLNAEFLLKTWLQKLPEDTVVFCQLIILFSLTTALSGGVQTIFNALGKVKLYSIWVSTILLFNIPISYVMFKMGYQSYTILVVAICLELVALGVRLVLLKKIITFSIVSFVGEIIFKSVLPMLVVLIAVKLSYLGVSNQIYKLLITASATLLLYPLILFNFSFNEEERVGFKNIFMAFKFKK